MTKMSTKNREVHTSHSFDKSPLKKKKKKTTKVEVFVIK